MYDKTNLTKFSRFGELAPESFKAFVAFDQAVMKHGVVPLNHMVCVTEKLAKENPAAVKAVYDTLKKLKDANPAKPGDPDTAPFGFDAVRPGVELAAQYAYEQRIIPRKFSFDEIFEGARKILG